MVEKFAIIKVINLMDTDEHIRHLEQLLEVSRRLSTAQDIEPFLQAVVDTACGSTVSQAASILEFDPQTDQLTFVALPRIHHDALIGFKIPLDKSIAGKVYREQEPLIVNDVSGDPDHFKAADAASGFETRSILAVPVVFRGEILGVMEVVNKHDQANYTEEDRFVVETLASQAAVALHNVRLTGRLQRSLDEMADLDRMKSDFIAIASHELRTPLGLILGYATFLREDMDPGHRPQLDIVVRSAMRLKEIVDNIANMDNLQRGVASLRRSPVSVCGVIEEVVGSFAEQARAKQISLGVDLPGQDLVVEGDASKIAIALSNLVENSLTFTNPGGQVQVSARQIPGCVKVSVVDNGIGIPADELGRIFERFYQVESHLTRRHGGMGLGLSVARMMIEMHAGRIWVESVEGRGSSFTFLLPVNAGRHDAGKGISTI